MKQAFTHQWFLILVAMITSAIYAYGFKGVFVYDDMNQIVVRGDILNQFNLFDVVFSGLRQHRVWQNLSFGLNWIISGGETWSFKLLNLILHLVNSWLLLKWLKNLFSDRPLLPVMTAALFLIHPLQIQSVTYVMGITTLIQSFFYLLSLYWFSEYRWTRMGGVLTILFLSLFSKETAVLIPLLLVAYEFLVFHQKGEKIDWEKLAMPFVVALLFIPFYLQLKDPVSMYDGVTGFDLYPFFQYLFSQFYYQSLYLSMMINPVHQTMIHGFPEFNWVTWIGVVFGFLSWGAALALLVFKAKKYPRISLLIFLYLISYFPTNSILQMVNPFAEYRLYLTNAILLIGVSWTVIAMSDKLKRSASFAIVFICAFIVYLSFFTFDQVKLWKDDLDIYLHSFARYPNHPPIKSEMGYVFANRCMNQHAEYSFVKWDQETHQQFPRFYNDLPYLHLASFYLKCNQPENTLRVLSQYEKKITNIKRSSQVDIIRAKAKKEIEKKEKS